MNEVFFTSLILIVICIYCTFRLVFFPFANSIHNLHVQICYTNSPLNIPSSLSLLSEHAGHFSQVVWKSSKEFGIGKAVTKDGKVIIVGNYKPPGNMSGNFPENVFPPLAEKIEKKKKKEEKKKGRRGSISSSSSSSSSSSDDDTKKVLTIKSSFCCLKTSAL